MPNGKSLNAMLDQLDSRLGKLEAETGKQAEAVLHDLDEITDRFADLKDQERLLAVERDQFQYLQSRLRKNMPLALHELGGPAGLQRLRAERNPDRSRWWWFLDEEIAAKRRKGLKGTLTLSTIVFAVVAVLILVYQFFLAPDPALMSAIRYKNDAYTQLTEGKIEQALQSVDQALTNQPDDPELMIFKGLLLQKLEEDPQQVTDLFNQAEQALGSQEQFLLTRARLNLQVGNIEMGLADAQTVIQSDPASALGHYYAGMAYETLGSAEKALGEYESGYKLADQQGQTELAATIRVAYAMLGQSVQVMPPTETP